MDKGKKDKIEPIKTGEQSLNCFCLQKNDVTVAAKKKINKF